MFYLFFFVFHFSVSNNKTKRTENLKEIPPRETLTNNPLNYDKSEIVDFPLPEIPVKKSKQFNSSSSSSNQRNQNDPFLVEKKNVNSQKLDRHHQERKFKRDLLKADLLQQQKMHYRNIHEKPTYLFGDNNEHKSKADEIFLNKSGWVQVTNRENEKTAAAHQPRPYHYPNSRSPKPENHKNIVPSTAGQKINSRIRNQAAIQSRSSQIENLISRNEARKGTISNQVPRNTDKGQYPGIRPGYLPVRNLNGRDSPPPVTPILSPPPAFQDTNNTLCTQGTSRMGNIHISVTDYENRSPKGMVFSRSFEYDTRKNNVEYNEIFSKSFDYDFKTKLMTPENQHIHRQKSMTFSTLTGNSPNYLSKKETFMTGPQMDIPRMPPTKFLTKPATPTSKFLETPVQQYNQPPQTEVPDSVKIKNFTKYKSLDDPNAMRSRRAQFSRIHREDSNSSFESLGFRSLDATGNLRLQSCDSGARSGRAFKTH